MRFDGASTQRLLMPRPRAGRQAELDRVLLIEP